SRLGHSAIRDGLATNDSYLHGRGTGVPRFVRRRRYRPKEKFLRASRVVLFGFASVVASVCKSFVLDGRPPPGTDFTFHAVFGVTLLIGALTQQEWYHKTLVVFTIATFVLYTVLLYTRMH